MIQAKSIGGHIAAKGNILLTFENGVRVKSALAGIGGARGEQPALGSAIALLNGVILNAYSALNQSEPAVLENNLIVETDNSHTSLLFSDTEIVVPHLSSRPDAATFCENNVPNLRKEKQNKIVSSIFF